MTQIHAKRGISIGVICRGLWVIAILLTCTWIGYESGQNSTSLVHAFTLATTHQPERFTELYFSDYAAIPKTVTVGQAYQIPVTVVNDEAETYTYTYQAWEVVAGARTSIGTGGFTLTAGGSSHPTVNFTPLQTATIYQIVFELGGLNQQINVRVTT
jgi:hypothetical protein